jgi:DNA replication ATP-dependent helicase Dna2
MTPDIVDADTTDKQTTIVLARKSGAMLQKGQEYIIRHRYIDFLLERVATTLRALDADPENVLLQLLSNPNLEVPFPYAPDKTLVQHLQNPDHLQQFSPSQRAAFDHAQRHRVQVLWGPPGTGKTNYLSISLLNWLQAAISSTPNFLVIITAFTKHAIRELLRSLRVHYQKWVDTTRAQRWPSFADLCTFAVSEFEDKEAHKEGGYTLLAEPKDFAIGGIKVLCGTVHQLAKYRERMVLAGGADLLIIDEGSQMLFADASIPLSLLNKLNGRLVIAGDHLQLPPILKADYPPTEPGGLHLTASVLQAFLSAGTKNPQADFLTITQQQCPVLTQLTENWRSNKEIGTFTHRLYHTGYDLPPRPVEQLHPDPTALRPTNLLATVLQTHLGESPLALVVVEVRTTGNMLHAEVERRVEGSLVRRLVQELRDACPSSPCYVPTPHRAQRFFIGKRLAEWTNTMIDYKGNPFYFVLFCFFFS